MKKTLKKIFSSYIERTWKTKPIFILVFWFFTALIIVVEPLIFTKIIKVIENYYDTGIFNSSLFIKLIIFWGIFILFSIVVLYFYRYNLVAKTLIKSYNKNVSYYSKNIIDMTFWLYLKKQVWSIYKIFDRWNESYFYFLQAFFTEIYKSGIGVIIIIVILFLNNVTMALITLAMLPFMLLMSTIFYKKLYPIQKKLNSVWDSLYWDIWNIMSNFGLTKLLTIEWKFKKTIDSKIEYCSIKQLSLDKWWSISENYTAVFVMISRLLVLWFGTYFFIEWKIDFTTLFLFFSYIWWIYFPTWAILGRFKVLQEQITAVEKFYNEFDNIENDNILQWKKLKNISWNIEYKNLFFSYNEKNNILNNLSFKIDSGEKIALVWNTWSGKSTIINLLLRFWDSTNWDILIDWKNIKTINKISIRQHIWVVSQDNSLFNLSIKENLLFANSKATKKDIEKALKKAEANFVFDLENGLDTIIWERWLKLSGWEKQRLSIARLFLKDPKILVLDEATSALDNKTELLVHRALEKLMKWRTTIIIAHRLSTIQNADKILVIEKWTVVESWKYKELMDKHGKFYALANPDNLTIN